MNKYPLDFRKEKKNPAIIEDNHVSKSNIINSLEDLLHLGEPILRNHMCDILLYFYILLLLFVFFYPFDVLAFMRLHSRSHIPVLFRFTN